LIKTNTRSLIGRSDQKVITDSMATVGIPAADIAVAVVADIAAAVVWWPRP
jgi:hypothetical protein